MDVSKKLKGSDIFDIKLLNILTPFYEIFSFITVIFTLLLIAVIITKTPKSMKNFKTYLLPYTFFHLLLEVGMLIFCPTILHPFVYVYSLGIAKYLPTNIFFLLMMLANYFINSILDCVIAMNLERFYAMKNRVENHSSKIPTMIFGILSGLSSATMIFLIFVAFFKPLYSKFIIPEELVSAFVETKIDGLDSIINVNRLLIFHSDNFIIPFIPLLLTTRALGPTFGGPSQLFH